jgi:hypothetical protein
MQKYVYTFVERRDTETYAVTGELPQRGDRVYLSPMMQYSVFNESSTGESIEFQVASIERILETSGERVRVVLDRVSTAHTDRPSVQQRPVWAGCRSYPFTPSGAPPLQIDEAKPENIDRALPQPGQAADDPCPFEATGEIQPDADSTSPTLPTNPLEELRKFAASIDHKLHTPSDSHVQIRKGTKVLLDWWPTTHKTRTGNKRGPDCASAVDVIEFLKSLVESF